MLLKAEWELSKNQLWFSESPLQTLYCYLKLSLRSSDFGFQETTTEVRIPYSPLLLQAFLLSVPRARRKKGVKGSSLDDTHTSNTPVETC